MDPLEIRVRSIEEPRRLLEYGNQSNLSVSFDLEGLGDLCKLRIVLPSDFCDDLPGATASSAASESAGLDDAMLDARVTLTAELATSNVGLSSIARIQVGDLIPVDPSDPDGVIVHVEGQPKFRAVRGAVGQRLAVQITDRL
jgi:flagellar motor switch protein FliM